MHSNDTIDGDDGGDDDDDDDDDAVVEVVGLDDNRWDRSKKMSRRKPGVHRRSGDTKRI
jgi:hypothetical protein